MPLRSQSSILVGWTVEGSNVYSAHVQETLLFSARSRTDLGTTEPLSQWVAGALSQGFKRPGYEPTTRLHKVPIELYIRSTYAIMARCLITSVFSFYSTIA